MSYSYNKSRREFVLSSGIVVASALASAPVLAGLHATASSDSSAQPPKALQGQADYLELLHSCYKDELWGSRVFALIATTRKMAAREQALLRVLASTELTMQGLLEEILRRHNQIWDETSYATEADANARSIASKFGTLPWENFNAKFEASIPPYLKKYRNLRNIAPSADKAVMDLFVEHELNFLHIAKTEQIDSSSRSLGPLWETLQRAQRLALELGISIVMR